MKQKVILIGNAQSWFENGESLQESRFDETFLVEVVVLIECEELDSSSRFAKDILTWSYDVPTWSYDVLEYDEYHLAFSCWNISNPSIQPFSTKNLSTKLAIFPWFHFLIVNFFRYWFQYLQALNEWLFLFDIADERPFGREWTEHTSTYGIVVRHF